MKIKVEKASDKRALDFAPLDRQKSSHFRQSIRLNVLCCAIVGSFLNYLRSEQKAKENHLLPPKFLLLN